MKSLVEYRDRFFLNLPGPWRAEKFSRYRPFRQRRYDLNILPASALDGPGPSKYQGGSSTG